MVTDELKVVTVTYSPGPHLDRFLASLAHATDRPVTVIMADNGSTDGAPEEAVRALSERPAAAHRRQSRVRHRREPRPSTAFVTGVGELFIVANPDVQWGRGSIDELLEAAGALAAGRRVRAADPRSGRLGVPVGPASAQPDPRGHARRGRPGLEDQPVDGGLPAGATGRPANGPSAGCPAPACCCAATRSTSIGGFDERYFMYMEDVDLGDRLERAGRQNIYVPTAEILHDKGHSTGRDPAQNLAAHHRSTYTFLADRHSRWWQAPLRWTIRGALATRAGLVVRNSRRKQAKGRL